jgi:DNA-binding transcriptional LysR family regulator
LARSLHATVWATSARHLAHEDDPLPLALFERGCWFRDHALAEMDRLGRRYRIACSSASVAGVRAAVAAGLAVAVLGRSTLPAGARVLSLEDGFPSLPGSDIALLRRPGPLSEAATHMATAITGAFAAIGRQGEAEEG